MAACARKAPGDQLVTGHAPVRGRAKPPWARTFETTHGTTRSANRVGRVLPTTTCSFDIRSSNRLAVHR